MSGRAPHELGFHASNMIFSLESPAAALCDAFNFLFLAGFGISLFARLDARLSTTNCAISMNNSSMRGSRAICTKGMNHYNQQKSLERIFQEDEQESILKKKKQSTGERQYF